LVGERIQAPVAPFIDMTPESSATKRPPPVVAMGLLAVAIACVLLFAWHRDVDTAAERGGTPIFGAGRLEPFRTPGGTLHTNGFVKTEELRKDVGSWRGTTSSGIRVDATYRYDVELRANWNFYVDDARRTAIIVAPPYKAQLPVATDSTTLQEWTSSGWGRFDKWDQLEALRQEMSPFLARKANSRQYLDIARGDARKTVEEFATDWLLKTNRLPSKAPYVVKVYFADEPDIPLPDGKTVRDFLP
jgi:hypothetical protein